MTPRILALETSTHGRVLVEDAADGAAPAGLIVAFHGYGHNAQIMLDAVRQIPGASRWRIASVQALHRFYARDSQTVIASWMTREDRELAIADNVAYVDRAIEMSQAGPTEDRSASRVQGPPVVLVGFSQGTSMAYRAALLGRHGVSGVIALGGDIPPELKTNEPRDRPHASARAWPAVLIGAGATDPYYTATKLDSDLAFLSSRGVPHDVVRYAGGHEWTEAFRRAAGDWLATRA